MNKFWVFMLGAWLGMYMNSPTGARHGYFVGHWTRIKLEAIGWLAPPETNRKEAGE